MLNITLIIIPGNGATSLSVNQGTTIADLIQLHSLHGRDIIVNGTGILPSNYSDTFVSSGDEIFATGSVKGNSNCPTNCPSQTGCPSGGR